MINDKIEEVYLKYNKEVYLYAYSLCKDHHLSQDLTSDTFLKAYLSMSDDVEYIKYWLFRVCKNLYIDHVRKNHKIVGDRQLEEYDSVEKTSYISNLYNTVKQVMDYRPHKKQVKNYSNGILDKMIESEDKRILYDKIINLKSNYKELIILYYFCDFNVKEISTLKNISESSVKTTLLRARMKLKQEMEGDYGL